jgi:hypothetical protein
MKFYSLLLIDHDLSTSHTLAEAPFKELSQQLSEAFIETLRTRRLSFDVLRERFAETSIMDREAVARMCASMAADGMDRKSSPI